MKDEERPRRKKQYLATTVRNGEMDEAVLTNSERARLDPSDVDVHIDEAKREIWIKADNGEAHPAQQAGFGAYEWELLADAVFLAGDINPLESNRAMNARVRRIRRLFGDSKDEQHYIRTTAVPYGIAINTERTWRYVEALAQ